MALDPIKSLLEELPSGGKLDGLIQLPPAWVPPYFIIPHTLHHRWLKQRPSRPEGLIDLLTTPERNRIEMEVTQFGSDPQAIPLIVRSNAEVEGLQQRGTHKSVRSDGTVEAIMSAATEIFRSAPASSTSPPIGLIVQLYCAPVLSGHLSNERRVSENSRGWICEIDSSTQLGKESTPHIRKWRVEKAPLALAEPLLCSERSTLFNNLRSVGKYIYEKKERRHLEWVWDGMRLWIVQNDIAPEPKGESPETTTDTTHPPVGDLSQFKSFTRADAQRWQKLKCAEVFQAMGRPTTALYVLRGSQKIRDLIKKTSLPGLRKDLRQLTKSPLVIRTDISGQTTFLAKRTDGLCSAESALKFLRETAQELIGAGIKPERICFIAHRFIPAHASAFSMATPKGTRVSVDALWGLPDGLEFCSHDSFEVETRNPTVIASRIRHKPSFLAVLPDNSWQEMSLAPPWDWKPSIDKSSVLEIASFSRDLAIRLNKTVVIMWFARIPNSSGLPEIIPWRYTNESEITQVESAIGQYFLSKPFSVRNDSDIELLKNQTEPISSVVLKPDGPHLRDKGFLEKLGQAVASRGLRIDLEGSPLAHTYYVLERTGAHVACVDPIRRKGMRRRFAKLVRDKIPVRIQTQGEKVIAMSLPQGELKDVLKAKLVEEAMEVLSASSPESLQEEMVDVLEVLIALSRMGGGSLRKLEQLAGKKRRSAGGFGKGLILVQTEEMPLLGVRAGDSLFDSGGIKEARDSYQAIVAAGRRLKTRRDRIVIPLIPSVPDRLRGPTRITFRNPDLEFEIWYREKTVEVILVSESKDSSAQLSLPFPKILPAKNP
jgi:predicted house-cleaning noncanonical NTP pyrophosphatase (MazG superfamily)